MKKVRWQDYLSMLVGLWIAVSPWVLGFADDFGMLTWNALAVGGGITILAAIDMDAPANWEEWAMIALGGWAAFSPWVLGFMTHGAGTVSMVASGIAVAALAGWALAAAKRPQQMDKHAHGH